MKRFLVLLISLSLLLAFSGCVNEVNDNGAKNEDDLYAKAIDVLDELSDDVRIKDFRTAYDLLMSLPINEDKFVSQLEEIEQIFSKYNVELDSGDYYLTPNISFTQEDIEKYKSKGAYYDANDLLNAIVYPVLFEKYGEEAQSIEGVTADTILSAIKSTNDYTFDEKKEQYDNCREIWKYVGTPKSKYEVKYHSNGLVESIDIPIVRSNNPLNDNEYASYFEKDIETQKQIAGNRFISMSNQFSSIFTGYEVLSQIFTDEEINIISNYIHSLTLEDIWNRNLMAINGEPTTYVSAIVVFDYKGNNIAINYGLNDITLEVMANNLVNPLTHRWYTLWCGLCLPEGEGKEETIKTYSDCINNNTAANDIVQEWSFDLNANADKYKASISTSTEPNQGDNIFENSDVQQSIPVEMSMSETLTTYGVIEKNNTAFPSYRLRLTTKLTIIFDEYIGEKVFECEYLYFYDDPELNNNYPFEDFIGDSCEVTALLEDYRGGNELFLLNPTIIMN